jgi:DNA-binding CsgD family transcriptional regulator
MDDLTLPIRGRSMELSILEELVGSGAGGQGGVLVLEGPPGIGKSRLLRETTRLAAAKTLVVGSASGDELDQLTPWRPLLAALSSTDPPVLDPAELSGLDAFLDRRLEVPQRMRSALESVACTRAVLVALDDLQWVDPATLSALGTLPQQLFSYPIVWLLARRPVPTSAPLDALLARLRGEGASLIRLGPLAPEDAVLVAADLLGRVPAGGVGDLVAQAGGNPLYLAEMLRDVGDDSLDAGRGIPASLLAAVGDHLRLLSERARQFLKVASVLGPTFSLQEVSAITGEAASILLAPVEETLASEVIVEQEGSLRFRHDLFRRAVYDELPRAVLPALHRDAARALLSMGAPLVRAANHLLIGARPGDDHDIEALTNAAFELFGTSPHSAADLAVRAVDLIPSGDPRRSGGVILAVNLLGWAGRLEEARGLGEGHLGGHGLPVGMEAEIYAGIARAWGMHSLSPCPVRPPPPVLADPSVPASTRADLILFGQLSDLWTAPEEAVEARLGEAEALGPSEFGTLPSVRLAFRVEHGRLQLALEEALQALHEGPEAGGPAAGAVEHALGFCLLGVGRLGEALEVVTKGLEAASASGATFLVVNCQSRRVMVLLELGRLDDARAEAAAAVDHAERLGFEYYERLALALLAETAVRQGDIDQAAATLRRLPFDPAADVPAGDQAWGAALCADAGGDPELGVKLLEPVIDRMRRSRLFWPASNPARLPRATALALRAGDRRQAQILAGAAAEIARRNPGLRVAAANEAHCRGLIDADPEQLGTAVSLLAEGERPLATAAAQEDLSHLLADSAERQVAIECLESAHTIYEACKAGRDAARTKAGLYALGVRKHHPSVARADRGWVSLTSAELRVVHLVARGRTNRQAATELYVSPETVNTHLRHAFTKLAVRSRVELTRLVIEHEASAP